MLFARAKRYGEHLHVLMLDIDHFKNVNDKLGHPVGDEVLKNIADILATQVRASDVVTRYGGEEFLVFLIQTEPEVAQFIANRIRDAVASHAFPDVPWQLTISIGVAGIKADDTLGELVDRADKYLYASKHGGRNRVSGF
jgi:diguanylate cyclase (GGDEF)-like protein